MTAEARRRAEEPCIKSSALTCVTHDWAPMVVCEQGLANALAQAGRERETVDAPEGVRERLKEYRRLLSALGCIWVGEGYTIDWVYKLNGRPAITRSLSREINNQIAKRFGG